MHKKYRTRLRQARRRINQIYKENKEVLSIRTNELTQDKKAAVYFLPTQTCSQQYKYIINFNRKYWNLKRDRNERLINSTKLFKKDKHMSSLDESRIRTILWAVRLIRSLQDQTHRSLRQLHLLHSQKRLQKVERTIIAKLAELLSEIFELVHDQQSYVFELYSSDSQEEEEEEETSVSREWITNWTRDNAQS